MAFNIVDTAAFNIVDTTQEPITATTTEPIVYRISEQNSDLDAKIDAFDYSNPLGLTMVQEWLLMFYVPQLVIATCCLNAFGLYVLQGRYLSKLVCQPVLMSILILHMVLIMTGPLYIWLMQCYGLYFTQSSVFPCFLLTWAHNFSMVASSYVLIVLVVERTFTIGRSELVWDMWQAALQAILHLVYASTLVMSVLGLLHIDGTVAEQGRMYPVCVPWWQNEHRSIGPLWFKILAMLFSLGPCGLVLMALVALLIALARFKLLLRWSTKALNHYSALLIELKATMHFKFVNSSIWLTALFVLMTAPLGLLIVIGPTVFVKLNRKSNITDLLYFPDIYPRDSNQTLLRPKVGQGQQVHQGDDQLSGLSDQPEGHPFELLSSMQISYLLLSRTDIETSIWLLYYSFPVMVVPVLLTTEVLFSREWRGRMLQLWRALLCRTREAYEIPDFSDLWAQDACHPENHVCKVLHASGGSTVTSDTTLPLERAENDRRQPIRNRTQSNNDVTDIETSSRRFPDHKGVAMEDYDQSHHDVIDLDHVTLSEVASYEDAENMDQIHSHNDVIESVTSQQTFAAGEDCTPSKNREHDYSNPGHLASMTSYDISSLNNALVEQNDSKRDVTGIGTSEHHKLVYNDVRADANSCCFEIHAEGNSNILP